jgi:hypothetical protein
VDARAKALGVSRNRLILDALESTLGGNAKWPPELIAALQTPLDAATAKVLDESMSTVRRRRRSRARPPKL